MAKAQFDKKTGQWSTDVAIAARDAADAKAAETKAASDQIGRAHV